MQTPKNPDNIEKKVVNFDFLVEQAKRGGSLGELHTLYRSFLTLEHWVYISPCRLEPENAKPFIGLVDDKPWVFIFTDSDKATSYGKQFDGFVRGDGSVFLIRMKVENSLQMLFQLAKRGVWGIRVNEGPHGWFCPIHDLPNIINYLTDSENK